MNSPKSGKSGVRVSIPAKSGVRKSGVRVSILPGGADRRARTTFAALSIALIAGCGAVPTQNYYVLNSVAASTNATAASKSATGISILVDPAHVPEAVDRPQLVISDSDNQVTILEQQRGPSRCARRSRR